MNDTETDSATPRSGIGGLLAYWGPPILLGAAVGVGVIFLWNQSGFGKTDVDRVVDRWEWPAVENEPLVDEIVAMGPEARADVYAAFAKTPGEYFDLKMWIAEILADDPFFDVQSLVEACRGDDGWNRRCSAVVLARRQGAEADQDLVMPGILEWLEDLTIGDHEAPILALGALGPLSGEWHVRARAAILGIMKKRAPVTDDPDEDWTPDSRSTALLSAVPSFLPDSEMTQLMLTIIQDEDDHETPRIAAIRTLSEQNLIDDPADWKVPATSSSEAVRQATSENLFRTRDPRFDELLQPMHVDASPSVREGSIDTQIARGSPTMLPVLDQLFEDHDVWVRAAAMHAAATFRKEPGAEARNGMLVEAIAASPDPEAVEAAFVALYAITGSAFGIDQTKIYAHQQEVEASELQVFLGDADGRANAAQRYREAFKGTAVWTTQDRIATLTKLLEHADPENVARAHKLLEELQAE